MSAGRRNEWGQPVGEPVPGWTPPSPPSRDAMQGRWCRVEPLDAARHADGLFAAYAAAPDARGWTYLPRGPFADRGDCHDWARACAAGDDPLFHAVLDPGGGHAVGVASYLRIAPAAGSIEVGHIHFAPALQRTPAATESMYLMMRRAFELGYRRYEWKCDSLNAPSRVAAQRLGFAYEGTFRQALVYKGRNRDTAWYAIIDAEWPALRSAFERWLDPANFDAEGRQVRSLSALTARVREGRP